MGLFDNIFLDKDTPTVMLDPLLNDQQKKANAVAREQQKARKETSLSSSQENTPSPDLDMNVLSDDQVMEIFDGPSAQMAATSSGEVGYPPIHPVDEVSFDIGGVDLPVFDGGDSIGGDSDAPAVGGFLSGNPPPIMEITHGSSISSEVHDASIAMVQGATSGASENIIDTSEESVSEHSETNPVEGMKTNDSMAEMLNIAEISPDAHTVQDGVESNISDIPFGSGILDMIDSVQDTSLPTTHGMDSLPSGSSEDNPPIDSFVSAQVPAISDAPMSELETLLAGFIAQLEEFQKNNSKVNTEMDELEANLKKEELDLEEEYATRTKAIEYRKKHINETRTTQSSEQARLEKIIASLQAELAH